ncbi:hypothetical protein B0J14DRAFT_571456 [Halenospora varia]|nr:hypothetical protein B0J14DRAFT_571456 [Halenospora varia]
MNMRYDIQYHATKQERKPAEDQEENFRGTACVSLRRLNFKPEYLRDVDRKNIERLKRIFARQGCLRISPSNHVPAIITKQDLKVALQHSGRTLKDLLNTISPEAKAVLSKEYSNLFNFADGKIYGKIRDYQRQNKPFAKRRWRAYLSKGKQKGLGQLPQRERFKEAFDTLLVVCGLWPGPGFLLGNMQEVLAMPFDNVC